MASLPGERAPSPSLRHGVRCVPEQGVSVESVLLAVGEQIGCENISSASRMNKAVVVFLKEERLVAQLIESGVVVNGGFCPILPLATLTSKVIISNVPPFIPDEVIERELIRFGRIASPLKIISLGCKSSELKHVMSFRRQVFMFLKEPTLDISFRVMDEGNLDLTGPKQVFKAENNSWVTPIADQFQLGISHVFEYIRSETYKYLYGRHLQANPEAPKKNADKSKKISRKPLAAKNK